MLRDLRVDLSFVELCVHDNDQVSAHVDRPGEIAWHDHHLYRTGIE